MFLSLQRSSARGRFLGLRGHVTEAAAGTSLLHPLVAEVNSGPKPFSAIPGPPQWPVLGSLPDFMAKKGAIAPWLCTDHYYKEYGAIVQQNLLGEREVLVYNPKEYLKVFQAEGPYPKGLVSNLWPFLHYAKSRFGNPPGLLADGETWQTKRRQLQKHMFAPQVAATYAPMLGASARRCSEQLGLALKDGELKGSSAFLEKCIFELFTAFAFGEPKRVLSDDADSRDLQFVVDSQEALSKGVQLCMNPLAQYIPTKKYKEFEQSYDRAYARAKDYVQDYVEARKAGKVGPFPVGEEPFLERCLASGEFTTEDLELDVANVFMAAVDTTVHVVKWLMLQLAANPSCQERLYQEVKSALKGRDYARDDRAELPYLHAALRESHRLTPTSWQLTYRFLDNDIVLGGYTVPAGTKIIFDTWSVQHDPQVVGEDLEAFKPERFLPEAVEARKSDPLKSLLDHRLLSTPFSFGARMCMGARIAEMELAALIARLVQDWRFELHPPEQPWEMTWGTMTKAEPYPSFRFQRR